MKVYSIYFEPVHDLSMEDCLKSDTLNAGMMEQVLENLVEWHDIQGKDLNRVMDYIKLEFGHLLVNVTNDSGNICYCAIQL